MSERQSQECRVSAPVERERKDRSSNEPVAWLAAPAVAVLAVACCAGPLLIAGLLATGAGAWLAAHGHAIAAAALLGLALLLVWGIRRRMSRG